MLLPLGASEMPLLMRFLISYTNLPNWLSLHIFHGFDLPPGILVGRAIALLRVDEAASGDRISTDTLFETGSRHCTIAQIDDCVPWIEPEDAAPVVVFLASDAARMVSGPT
jgi:hypothetical protein